MPLFTDQTGRTVAIDHPTRIVSLVPSLTELLHDLGLDEEVRGITKFCVHPRSWFRKKTRVGGTKQLHAATIASLDPDLIIANKEENVKEQVEALCDRYPVWISDIHNLRGALEAIRNLGEITGRK
ncbi:MAG TPA: helical backbone metal receptor, partial [Flavisolibacter sp.]|nr:helical backbone metal receptor [Flavisolibacter sp.]